MKRRDFLKKAARAVKDLKDPPPATEEERQDVQDAYSKLRNHRRRAV